MMLKPRTLALVAALTAIATSGCNNFLTGDKLNNNPNKPISATADQLFIGVEVAVMGQWETYPMNLLPLWAQQIAGVNRQWATYSVYSAGTDDLTSDGMWNAFYDAGGLADIRRGEKEASDDGNQKQVGQFRVLEALYMGTAADIWGSVPYDSAGTPFPKFDSQAEVYAHVQAVLDSAITDLAGAGNGAVADFYFAGDFDKWTAVAHTLKARFYMHTAENQDFSYNTTILQQVLDETAQGIADPSGSLETKHSQNNLEQNLFYQFLVGSRKGDVEPSAIHINLAKQFNDDVLLAQTYSKNASNQYVGSPAGASAGSNVSNFSIAPDAPMGLVTYSENILLDAEARYRLGDTSPSGTAAQKLNDERAAYGESGPAVIPSGTNGLLVGILEEKYVRNFLNPEVYFDYLRTCVPNIALPAGSNTSPFDYVPARFKYGHTEATTNLANVPADPTANGNWPAHPTGPAGIACAGQAGRGS
jgi:hypothetical protein